MAAAGGTVMCHFTIALEEPAPGNFAHTLEALNVASWLKADIQPPEIEVRLSPRSGHSEAYAGLPVLTHNGSRGSPMRDTLYRRLQPFRHLHDCSGCFRLERWLGGTCTHWKSVALARRTPVADNPQMCVLAQLFIRTHYQS